MGVSGIHVFSARPDQGDKQADGPNAMRGILPGNTRRGTLSLARITELVADLMDRRFYGKLALHFEAGHIVCAKLEQSIKE